MNCKDDVEEKFIRDWNEGKVKRMSEPVAMKFQIYKQTPPRGGELEPINSALLPWVYDQDPSSGNTASMWVTPVATLPPQTELEPVAWWNKTKDAVSTDPYYRKDKDCIPLYTAPQREWKGLTITEAVDLWEQSRCALPRYHTFKSLITAKLKEKNT